ncbi:GNAT family N-acetyltransferase [Orrella daihaiensis]|uniref:GNAT family N-acetyltransferase n=1 Tax=Orrella daihaiensis TaxID=2782176 RepID=A0ABY4ASH0_9BURK|nr:GNAT family N-acetyltransferase [Orrella daihaiensis]UOD50989.1 GNAT family N-acetyltransferase [Orrella daihaiensis]
MSPSAKPSTATHIRPIQAADLSTLKSFLSELSPGTLYFRFGRMSMPMLTEDQWHELCEPDPLRCAQFVATQITGSGRYAIVGMARLLPQASEDGTADCAEFSLVVADHLQNQGVGRQLMHTLVGEASRRGLGLIYGDVLPSNTTMLSFCEGLGFVLRASPDDSRIHRMMLSIKKAQGINNLPLAPASMVNASRLQA